MTKAKKPRDQRIEGPKELMSSFCDTKKAAETRFSCHTFSVKAEVLEEVETAIACRRTGTITQGELCKRIRRATESIVRTQCAWFRKNIIWLLEQLVVDALFDIRKQANLWRFKDDELSDCRKKRLQKSLDKIEEFIRQSEYIDLERAKVLYDETVKVITSVCDEQFRIEKKRHDKLNAQDEAERQRREEQRRQVALKQAEEEAAVLEEMLKSA